MSLGFLGVIVVAGVVVWAIDYYGKNLPEFEHLGDYRPSVVTRVYAWDGRLMAEFAEEKRVFIPIESIPDHVKQAFISAEDKTFYQHKGVDLPGIVGAMRTNIMNIGSDRRLVGASTITQQVAKNFLLTNEVSYERKIKEMLLAFRIENALSKDKILELYLNEIFLGQRSYGVGAAALTYFGKALGDLSLEEAAYLAALPKAPNNYHPVHHKDRALGRRNWVIERMHENGYINEVQTQMAQAKPLDALIKSDDTDTVKAPYFAEEIRRFMSETYGDHDVYNDGLLVRTSLNPEMQNMAQAALRQGLMEYDRRHGWRGAWSELNSLSSWQSQLGDMAIPVEKDENWRMGVVLSAESGKATIGFIDGTTQELLLSGVKWARKSLNKGYLGDEVTSVKQVLNERDVIFVEPIGEDNTLELRQIPKVQGAIVVLDPQTGRVLAMQGGWAYGSSEFNRVTQAKRQPGSAFKPFIYLAALEKGYLPTSIILDAPVEFSQGPGLAMWRPSNYSGEYYGPTPIRVGVEKSRNLMTVRLANQIGMESVSDLANRFNIYDDLPTHLANALGAAETSILRMTSAYAMLVNGGKRIEPTFIDRIQDRYGKTLYKGDTRTCAVCGDRIQWEGQMDVPSVPDNREQVVDPRHAYQMVSILEGVVQRGTGRRLLELGLPLAGKTGTTNDSKDAWFVGFSPDLAVGVYIGFDEPKTLGKRETGSSAALPIFKAFMETALKDKTPLPFRRPPGINLIQVNADTGRRASPGDSDIIWEAFLKGQEPGAGYNRVQPAQYDFLDGNTGQEYSPVYENNGTSSPSSITGTGGIY